MIRKSIIGFLSFLGALIAIVGLLGFVPVSLNYTGTRFRLATYHSFHGVELDFLTQHNTTVYVSTLRGRITIGVESIIGNFGNSPLFLYDQDRESLGRTLGKAGLGYSFSYVPNFHPGCVRGRTALWFSAFLVAAIVAAYPTLELLIRPLHNRRRRKRGQCVKCCYNLTGNVSGKCPECGTPVTTNDEKRES